MPSLPGVSLEPPLGRPEGTHFIVCQAPAQRTQLRPFFPEDFFSERPGRKRICPKGLGAGLGGVLGRSGARASRLKPPQDARNPLPLLFSSHRHCFGFLLCQHVRYGDRGGISLNRDAVPFGNICLEVPNCVTQAAGVGVRGTGDTRKVATLDTRFHLSHRQATCRISLP